MQTTYLIDSELLCYRAAHYVQRVIRFSADPEDFVVTAQPEEAAIDRLEVLLGRLPKGKHKHFISCHYKHNWRREILPEYHEARSKILPPVHVAALKQYMLDEYQADKITCLEGDDLIGLSSDQGWAPASPVIISYDKDLKQIPGVHYNPMIKHYFVVTKEEADHWHLMQALTGDPTDGFKGVPGVGVMRAAKVLEGLTGKDAWTAVENCYVAHGLTREDALLQARVARVLRPGEFDWETGEVKLWTPEL